MLPASGAKRKGRELPPGCEFHFFLSHYQASGGDQVDALQQELERRAFRCWYDNKMERLTKDAMAEGVQQSAFLILFLSEGVLTRPYVQFELEEAKKTGKQVLLVHEQDPRHNPFDFTREVQAAPLWL